MRKRCSCEEHSLAAVLDLATDHSIIRQRERDRSEADVGLRVAADLHEPAAVAGVLQQQKEVHSPLHQEDLVTMA